MLGLDQTVEAPAEDAELRRKQRLEAMRQRQQAMMQRMQQKQKEAVESLNIKEEEKGEELGEELVMTCAACREVPKMW